MSDTPPVRILKETLLANDWATLTKYEIAYRRRDGRSETQIRQVYDRGNGAGILPYDPVRGTVLLVRQFRLPVYINEGSRGDGQLIEVCAGLNDELDPESAIRKEAEEELGYHLHDMKRVFDAYMSPGSVSERLSLFTATYSPADRMSEGGGAADEGEDIEVLEMPLADAIARIDSGEICDGKAIILLQHVRLKALESTR